MNRAEAIAALDYSAMCPEIVVQTRSGAQYAVAYDIIEQQENGYVYGYRVNGPIRRGPFSKQQANGTVRWFDLKNVTLVEATKGESK